VVPFAMFSPSQFIVHVVKEKSKVNSHKLGLMACSGGADTDPKKEGRKVTTQALELSPALQSLSSLNSSINNA
jgi:hypothetical protein